MPMTITEKILAAHAGKEPVSPGELVQVLKKRSCNQIEKGELLSN